MSPLIINMNGTGAFAEVTNVPHEVASIAVQARTSVDIQIRYRGQVTYWTIKADTVRTFLGQFNQGDVFINAPVGSVVEIEFSTIGTSI